MGAIVYKEHTYNSDNQCILQPQYISGSRTDPSPDKVQAWTSTRFTTHTDVMDSPELTKPLNLPPQREVVKLLQLWLLGLVSFGGLFSPYHQVTKCIPPV